MKTRKQTIWHKAAIVIIMILTMLTIMGLTAQAQTSVINQNKMTSSNISQTYYMTNYNSNLNNNLTSNKIHDNNILTYQSNINKYNNKREYNPSISKANITFGIVAFSAIVTTAYIFTRPEDFNVPNNTGKQNPGYIGTLAVCALSIVAVQIAF